MAYMSPELLKLDIEGIQDNQKYNSKVDVWAIGALLQELCTLRPPFQFDKGKTSSKDHLERILM